MTELQTFAERVLDDLCARHPLGYRPTLVWKRLRVSAGIAYLRTGGIALSSLVLQDEQAVYDTLIHEYAHLLAVHRCGRRGGGHGAAWRQAMHDLGAPPRVYHRYEVQRNKPRQRVTYQCDKCGVLIHRQRRLPKRRHYLHSGCGGVVMLRSVERL